MLVVEKPARLGVLSLSDQASRMVFAEDRRRFKRFEIASSDPNKPLLLEGSEDMVKECEVLNLSYGGACFRASTRPEEGAIRQFRIDLASPAGFTVDVKARICWVRHFESQGYFLGAEFLESSKGWLGPEDG